jgi:hypothetical protein
LARSLPWLAIFAAFVACDTPAEERVALGGAPACTATLASDPKNCGACGHVCGELETCDVGV